MHPLFDNLKSLSYEELEKKNAEIHKRMQMYMRSQMHNPLIWNQLEQMRDSIIQEKQERASLLNSQPDAPHNSVMISTDPLDDDEPLITNKVKPNTFNPIS